MKKAVLFIVMVSFFLALPLAGAKGKATPQEVFEMVLKGVQVLEQLGEEGLEAFNDPKGEFVWKDTYVYVLSCEQGKVAAHPNAKYIGLTTNKIKCFKTGNPIMREACDEVNPKGMWKEYWWTKIGSEQPSRKVVFLVPVEGTHYQVGAGIYDESMSIEELEKIN